MALTPNQINEFYSTGYTRVHGVLAPQEVEHTKQAFDRLLEEAHRLTTTTMVRGSQFVVEGSRVDRVVWCGAAEPSLLKLGEDPRLLGPASEILDSPTMDQLICQAHFKMPGDEVEFLWHQDSENRRFGTDGWTDVNGKGSFVQTFVALDRITGENGPLLVIPKSCRLGHLGLDHRDRKHPAIREEAITPMLMEPGDMLLVNPYTIHASRPNNSDSPRRTFVCGYSAPGANHREYPGEGSGRRLEFKG